ncbi:ankyrin repeat-containing domain protein [Xylaria sp. FL1042]|nr:ankyrin repeat-containing domain protein [Xylaria sp. FL1042]
MTLQSNNQAGDIETIRDLSLCLTRLARLKFYHKAAEAVWDTQERLFPGWGSRVGVSQERVFIKHQETVLLHKFFDDMVFSNNPLAAFVAQAFNTRSTPFQRYPLEDPIPEAAGVKANHFRANGDVSTALAMQEIALLHEVEWTPLTCASTLLKYCDIYLETTERLTTIFGREVPALPPLHYFLLLAKNSIIAPPFTPIHSHFVSTEDYFGRSLLHAALDLGFETSVLPLIQLGASASAEDNWGRRPIHIACSGNSEALVKHVLENIVDYDVEDNLGRSALHYASSYGDESIVRLLLERGANIHHKDRDGQVPISWATEHGHTAVVQLLLESGADAESICRTESLLERAASQGHTSIVQALLKNGADVHGWEPFGQRALLVAARAGHTSTVELLLSYGASIYERDMYGRTALSYARKNGHVDVVKVLLKHGAGSSTLIHV